jgi:hypothetical protein
MTIYSENKKKRPPTRFARKAWVEFHGRPVPKDETGRSYDIHHIDGDPWNNSKENLYACPLPEHYDIHFAQEDWGACASIASRMKMSHEVISELARKGQKKLVDSGVHHLLGGAAQRKQVAEGKHPFVGGEIQRKLVTESKNALVGGKLQRKIAKQRIENGTFHLINSVTCRDKQGTVIQVPKEVYHKQKEVIKDQTQWEFAMINSSEGKRRKT